MTTSITPERVLSAAQAMTLTTVVVMGLDENGMAFFASSTRDEAAVLQLLKQYEQRLRGMD